MARLARLAALLVVASSALAARPIPADAAVQVVPQELRPEDVEAIEAGPVFTPFTARPQLRNRDEVIRALMMNYPPVLRDAGVGGRVVVWFYVSETGRVLNARISNSSGNAQLDEASLRVATVYQFTPAFDGVAGGPVSVWIQLPITFQVQN